MTDENSNTREIARAVFGEFANEAIAMTFEELWTAIQEQMARIDKREQLGHAMTDAELRRWWRQSVLYANALGLRKKAQHILDRAQTELRMLYFDAHETRGLPDDKPLTLDPVRGVVVEGPPPPPPAPDAPAGRRPLADLRALLGRETA